jgi:hypothetical protein
VFAITCGDDGRLYVAGGGGNAKSGVINAIVRPHSARLTRRRRFGSTTHRGRSNMNICMFYPRVQAQS